jgi:hypothetical protein
MVATVTLQVPAPVIGVAHAVTPAPVTLANVAAVGTFSTKS